MWAVAGEAVYRTQLNAARDCRKQAEKVRARPEEKKAKGIGGAIIAVLDVRSETVGPQMNTDSSDL